MTNSSVYSNNMIEFPEWWATYNELWHQRRSSYPAEKVTFLYNSLQDKSPSKRAHRTVPQESSAVRAYDRCAQA